MEQTICLLVLCKRKKTQEKINISKEKLLELNQQYLQISHRQLSEVYCLILYKKIFRLSEFFISFGKFPHRTAPIVLTASAPNLLVLIFLPVTVTLHLKSQKAF